MILGIKPVTLWAERIMRCTVPGAPTSKGRFKQLKSSLRSRRKLRLVWPGNGQKSVRLRSPWRPAGRKRRVSRLHFSKNWTIAGSRHAPEFPSTRAHYSRGERYCKNEILGVRWWSFRERDRPDLRVPADFIWIADAPSSNEWSNSSHLDGPIASTTSHGVPPHIRGRWQNDRCQHYPKHRKQHPGPAFPKHSKNMEMPARRV